jgi:hypothetical protein
MCCTRAAAFGFAVTAILAGTGCSPQDPFDEPGPAPSEPAVEPQRRFLSEAQAARARHYWTRESLEPYGVLPADATRSGKR